MDQKVLEAQKWLNTTYTGKSGYTTITEDGITGQGTVKALIIALQNEIGISSPNGTFGSATTSQCPTLSKNLQASPANIVKILQHGLFCKGYNPSSATGIFGDNTEAAIKKIQADAGLSTTGVVVPMLFKAILNTDPMVLASNGDSTIRSIQQYLNNNYNAYFDLIPCNGIYERNTNKALIYAFQKEEGLAVGVANGSFGPTTQSLCPVLSVGSTKAAFVKLLKFSLCCNTYFTNDLDGVFTNSLAEKVKSFQTFSNLPRKDGVADLDVWMSLLTSKGNTDRVVTGCDCSTVITPENVSVLTKNGYSIIGRYLTGSYKLSDQELQVLFHNNISVFPIFQRSGEGISATFLGYFTSARAIMDATDAIRAAINFGFKTGTVIFFALDFDCYDYQVTSHILPFFKVLKNEFVKLNSRGYRIGIYGPRNVCSRVCAAGYAQMSFVSDMSTAYSGNLGYPLPITWAFDQIVTVTISDNTTGRKIEIDKNAVRGIYMGESSVGKASIIPGEKLGEDEILFEDALDIATQIITKFETNANTFEEAFSFTAGCFDNGYVSFGIFQYNLGKGTLQPIIRDFNAMYPELLRSYFGGEKYNTLIDMCSEGKDEAAIKAWAMSISEGGSNRYLNDEWKKAFSDLGKHKYCQQLQMEARAQYTERAVDNFCDGYGLTTLRGFVMALNVTVNEWGLAKYYEEITDQFTVGMSDRDKLNIIKNYGDNKPRKEVIANGSGFVNGETVNLDADYGLNDKTIVDLSS